MRIRSWYILFIVLAVTVFVHVYAHSQPLWDWQSYDAQWRKRNPETRLEILTRAINHYRDAVALVDAGKIAEAKVRLSDALKVCPDFKEAHRVLASIYEKEGNARLVRKHLARCDALSLYTIEEYAYLKANLPRLKADYEPSRALDRVIFYALFAFGFIIGGYVFVVSDVGHALSMFIRRGVTMRRKKEESFPNLIIEEFPAQEERRRAGLGMKVLIYAVPFVLFFLVSRAFGARHGWELFLFTFFPGVTIDVLLFYFFMR